MSGQYHLTVIIITTKNNINMYSEIFESIGLSPNESKIYESLLHTGQTGVSNISNRANVHRRNVYDAINRLTEKGLVFPIFQKGENQYQAVHPDKLMELIKEKQTKLQHIMPELKKTYEAKPVSEAAYIYKGIEGYKNYCRDLFHLADEALFLGAKGLWHSPQLDKNFRDTYLKNFTKKIPHKILFDPRVKKLLPTALEEEKGNYKILPTGFETPGVVDAFGDFVVTFVSVGVGNFGDDVTIFVMQNKQLAESYKTWFKFMWEKCD